MITVPVGSVRAGWRDVLHPAGDGVGSEGAGRDVLGDLHRNPAHQFVGELGGDRSLPGEPMGVGSFGLVSSRYCIARAALNWDGGAEASSGSGERAPTHAASVMINTAASADAPAGLLVPGLCAFMATHVSEASQPEFE